MTWNFIGSDMSQPEDESNWIETLVEAFQDAHNTPTNYKGISLIPNETARSYLLRIITSMGIETFDESWTSAMSKEVGLTTLQCSAGIYADDVHGKGAVDLISSTDLRAILRLGVQDNLSNMIQQHCRRSIEFVNLGRADSHKSLQKADLLSAARKTKARRLNHQAMVIEHVSSLCRLHATALQNPFLDAEVDERFMNRLSRSLKLREKSWLISLLPENFHWGNLKCVDDDSPTINPLAMNLGTFPNANEDVANSVDTRPAYIAADRDLFPCSHVLGRENCPDRATPRSQSPLSFTPVATHTDLQYLITFNTWRDIQEAFDFADSSSSEAVARGTQCCWKASTLRADNELWISCYDCRIKHDRSDSEWRSSTSDNSNFESWMENLQASAGIYRNRASVEAVVSVQSR